MEALIVALFWKMWSKLQDWTWRWCYRKIIKPALAWIKTRLRPARQKLYAAIGIATVDDLEKARSAPAIGPSTPVIRTISRYGLIFRLDPDLEEHYLGRTQPSDVEQYRINNLIHGPFCPKCHHEMRVSRRDEEVSNRCVRCKFVWMDEAKYYPTSELKRFIYNDLDAEFSREGKIEDTDISGGC